MASGEPVSADEERQNKMLEYLAVEREDRKKRLLTKHNELVQELENIRDDGLKELNAVFDCLIACCNNVFSNLPEELRKLNISEENDDSAGLEREVEEHPNNLRCFDSIQQTLTFYHSICKRSHDFYTTSIFQCERSNCKTCHATGDGSRTCRNNSTSETYQIHGKYTCVSSNVIYLISCSHQGCFVQYVGETTLRLNVRMSKHTYNIRHKRGQLLHDHFNKKHEATCMRVKVLGHVHDKSTIRQVEEYWIRKLNTFNEDGKNPDGLNERHAYGKWDTLPERCINAATVDDFKSALQRRESD